MSKIAEDDARLKFMPLEQATVPPSGYIKHLRNRYWVVHPSKGLVFWREWSSPQCHDSRASAMALFSDYPWATITHIPSVFVPVKLSDFAP